MSRLAGWLRRKGGANGRGRLSRKVDDELGFHLEGRVDELIKAGWTRTAAEAEARRRFGSVSRYAHDCRRLDAELDLGKERARMVESFLSDLRHTFRLLSRNPTFAAATVFTLALGIGANAAMFSIVNAFWQVPGRFERSEELVVLWTQPQGSRKASISLLDWLDWREQSTAFAAMGAYRSDSQILGTTAGAPETIEIVEATVELLPMVGVRARLGRLAGIDDDAADAEPVVVLTDKLWQRRFGADPEILGQLVKLDGAEHTVIGVLEPKLGFDRFWREVDLFKPLSLDPGAHTRETAGFRSIGRLAPGVSIDMAQGDLDTVAARLATAYPATNADRGVFVEGFRDFILPVDTKFALASMLLAAASVLLIACVNLATFLLARASARGAELAVRIAIGAGHGRILRQLLTESLVLSMLGGGLGLMLSRFAVNGFAGSWQFGDFRASEIGLNPTVVIYTLGISTLAALVFGAAPAVAAARTSVGGALRSGGAVTASHTRWRSAIVVGQLALTIPLLVACVMAARQLTFLESLDYGFDTDNVLVMRIDRPAYRYTDDLRWNEFVDNAVQAIEAVPGIDLAAGTRSLPLGSGGYGRYGGTLAVEGDTGTEEQPRAVRGYEVITPSYFEAMGVSIVAGRAFAETDGPETLPVAVVNERLARGYWPDGTAVGKRFTFDSDAAPVEWITVVGVVADFGVTIFGEPIEAQVFRPHAQRTEPNARLVARSHSAVNDLVPAIIAAVQAEDPEVPIYGFQTVEAMKDDWLTESRLFTTMIGGIGVLALGLASIGLFGMISYSVTQRTREIGVRVALGARRPAIVRLVLGRSLRLTAIGVAAGAVLSTIVAAIMISSIHGTSAPRPATVAAVLALLGLVVALAAFVPARRATRIDPLLALRSE